MNLKSKQRLHSLIISVLITCVIIALGNIYWKIVLWCIIIFACFGISVIADRISSRIVSAELSILLLKAYNEGKQAAIDNIETAQCPYNSTNAEPHQYQFWVRGYMEELIRQQILKEQQHADNHHSPTTDIHS